MFFSIAPSVLQKKSPEDVLSDCRSLYTIPSGSFWRAAIRNLHSRNARPYGSAPLKHGRMTSTYGKFPRSGPSAPAPLCLCIEMLLATQVVSSIDAIKFRKLPGISETSDTILEHDLLHSPNCCNLKGRTQWPPSQVPLQMFVISKNLYMYVRTYVTLHDMTWHDMTWHDMTEQTIT